MRNYITIDGGTTNTRVSLVKNQRIVQTVKLSVGARIGIDNKKLLVSEIKKAVCGLSEGEQIERILASGMITSEFGLYNLPHISAPAGIAQLHGGMCEVVLDGISDIPIVFIPGVKVSDGTLQNTDMMRGEETELIGLAEYGYNECIYVLPGSHSKIIRVDSCGRISDFSTMLTGEMIAALSGATILKDAVSLNQSETDDEFLIKGYDYCSRSGINEALFKIRVLKNMFGATEKEVYSFFIGVVLQAEISKIADTDVKKIIIGGKEQIKNAMYRLLRHSCDKEVILVSDEMADSAPSLGMIRIYEYA